MQCARFTQAGICQALYKCKGGNSAKSDYWHFPNYIPTYIFFLTKKRISSKANSEITDQQQQVSW